MSSAERMINHVNELNQAWQDRQFQAIAHLYHPSAVLLPPDAGAAIVGRDAVLASYDDFAAAELVEFAIEGFDTFEFGDTGVCHMRFEIEYVLDGSRHHERGLEIYVIADVTSKPQIIWRSQSLTEISAIEANGPERE